MLADLRRNRTQGDADLRRTDVQQGTGFLPLFTRYVATLGTRALRPYLALQYRLFICLQS